MISFQDVCNKWIFSQKVQNIKSISASVISDLSVKGVATTTVEFDTAGNKTGITASDKQKNELERIAFTYDHHNHPESKIISEKGKVTAHFSYKNQYDESGRLLEVLEYKDNKLFNTEKYKYSEGSVYKDVYGNIQKSFIYDGSGKLISEVSGNMITEYLYDSHQNITGIKHRPVAKGSTRTETFSNTYDASGRLAEVIASGKTHIVFEYDGENKYARNIIIEDGRQEKYELNYNFY